MQKPQRDNSSNKNPFELPEERLASTEASGERHYIYPAKAFGPISRYRSISRYLLISIFLAAPWIKIKGHQAILLDIPNRKFALFGLTFWGHEAPLVFLFLTSFLLGIAIITAIFGRVWCGWACPQTVFIEGFFRKIENLIEGNGLSQQRFNQKRFTFKKGIKKAMKWALFIGFSLIITHSFLAYFMGSETVIHIIQGSPKEHPVAFITILITTLIILFDFGWFREQFCIIACPYGRFQSVIMDEHSKVALYDKGRGEPRKKDRNDTHFTGDCINCYRCVQVCPTGIDIRRGTQLECIMCMACVDACNQVMIKTNRPKGLIRYTSEFEAKEKMTKKTIRTRTIIYTTLLITSISLLTFTISTRNMTPIHAVRLSNPPYRIDSSGQVINHYSLTIHNQYFYPIQYSAEISDQFKKDSQLIKPLSKISIQPGKSGTYTFFIKFSPSLLNKGKVKAHLISKVERENEPELISKKEITLIGPYTPSSSL